MKMPLAFCLQRPTVRVVRLRGKRVRIGNDEDARNAAEMLAR